jgi:hypothetical protein
MGFKSQERVIRPKRRIFNRSEVRYKARAGESDGAAAFANVMNGNTASGGSIQEAERAPDQRLASFRRDRRLAVVEAH